MSLPKGSYGLGKFWLIYTKSFLSIQLLNELSYPFHLTYNLSPFFLLITFSILKPCSSIFYNSFSYSVPTIS